MINGLAPYKLTVIINIIVIVIIIIIIIIINTSVATTTTISTACSVHVAMTTRANLSSGAVYQNSSEQMSTLPQGGPRTRTHLPNNAGKQKTGTWHLHLHLHGNVENTDKRLGAIPVLMSMMAMMMMMMMTLMMMIHK